MAIVVVAWLMALTMLGGESIHPIDVHYLHFREAFEAGMEARRPLRHLSWGIAHLVGHSSLGAGLWSSGELGVPLSVLATFVVPLSAWAAWALARDVLPEGPGRVFAAAVGALSPSALFCASSVDPLFRWLAMAFLLLAATRGAAWIRGGRLRDGTASFLLLLAALAQHPIAAVGPLVALPLWIYGMATARAGRAWVRGSAAILVHGAAAAAVLAATWSGGGARFEAQRLSSAVLYEPTVAALHAWWQVPWIGRLAPHVPLLAGTVALALLLAGLSTRQSWRPAVLLLVGALLSTVPEGASRGFEALPALAWSSNHARASAAVAMASAVLLGHVAGSLWAHPRVPRRVLALALIAVAGAGLSRGCDMLHARSELRSDARVSLDFVAQRLVLPAAVAHATPALLGDSGSVLTGIRSLKWNPELPKSKRLKRKQHASEKSKDHMGVDYGLWVTAMVICEVWLGLKPSPVPADAAVGLARSGECRMPPLATKMEEAPKGKAWCTVDLSQADPVNSCGTPPPPRSAADSLDPRSRLLGFFGFAVVLIGVTLGGTRRSEDG